MDTDKELMLDVGQANEIKMAARRAGATNADLKKLTEGDMFAKILPVIRGLAQIVISKHLIDCDANPFLPAGWRVEQHKKAGQLEWSRERITLYLSRYQKRGQCIGGHDLRQELKNQPVLNANVLDYFLAHPELIPESWKGESIFFWGTVYCSEAGNLCVRYLCWVSGRWDWSYRWLGRNWYVCHPAALLASV